jgi:hypothetical protein
VEPLEFTSSGGRGEALSRQVKSRFLTFYEGINDDGFVKNRKIVTPVKTGVQNYLKRLDPRFRGGDTLY